MIILVGAAVIREREHGTIEHLIVMPMRPSEIAIAKIVTNGLVILCAALLSLWLMVDRGLGVPINGASVPLFIMGGFLYLFSVTSLGVWLATLAPSMPQFGLLAVPVYAIAYLLSGAATPVASMPPLAPIRGAVPADHAIRLVFAGDSLSWRETGNRLATTRRHVRQRSIVSRTGAFPFPLHARAAIMITRLTSGVASLGAAILLSGCVLPAKNPPASSVAVPPPFQEQAPGGEPDLSYWWTAWHDPALDQLIAEALEANTDIRSAQWRVAEARSLVTAVESTLYPAVAARGGVWRREADWRLPAVPPAIPAGLIPSPSHGFDAGYAALGASWEADVFGGRRSDVDAARAMASGAADALNGARMTVVADVAENYQQARGLQLRLDVLDRGMVKS